MADQPSRQTTVLFADVTGSTRLYEQTGNSGAADTLGRCIELLRQTTEAFGGRVIKTTGDGVMALFGTADAAAAAAARMHVAMQSLPPSGESKLGLRVGFHSGPVIQRESDVFGDTVNLASRLVEQATKGQVLTSDETASLLSPAIRGATRRLYSVSIRGKAEQIALCELMWNQSPDTTDLATTVSALRSPRVKLRLHYQGRDIVRRRGRESLSLGREDDSDIVVADPKASRRHCTIERRQDKFILRDHSTNGTFVTTEGEAEIMLRGEEFALRKHGWIAFGAPRTESSDVVEYFCDEAG